MKLSHVIGILILGVISFSCSEHQSKKLEAVHIQLFYRAPNISGMMSDYFVGKNQSQYALEVGDTLRIYYSTNSCCKFCIPTLDNLPHLKYLDHRCIIPSKRFCEGCNSTMEVSFKAISVGHTELKQGIISPASNCSNSAELETVKIEILPS